MDTWTLARRFSRTEDASCPPTFEVMPPRADAGRDAFAALLDGLAAQRPSFISVTCHRGQFAATLETAVAIQRHWGVPAMAHLPCRGLVPDEVRTRVREASAAGIRAFLVLRGDASEESKEGAIVHAVEGIRIVRGTLREAFIAAACHPLPHPDDVSPDEAVAYLRAKAEAGTDLLLAQFCLDPETFVGFRRRLDAAGIRIPVRAGILGVERWSQAIRAAERCRVPIEPYAAAVPEERNGTYVAHVRHLRGAYARQGLGAHLFTMNRPCWADPEAFRLDRTE